MGLSGIDGSGKGWVARRLAASLERAGLRVASLSVDLWLNLPARLSARLSSRGAAAPAPAGSG